MQAFGHQIAYTSGETVVLLGSAGDLPHLTDFLQLVPRGFFSLGISGDQKRLSDQAGSVIRHILNRTREKFVLILALLQQFSNCAIAAVPGQYLVFPIAQRGNDQIMQHMTSQLNSRFQILDIFHRVKIIFRRDKVIVADALDVTLFLWGSGKGGRVQTAGN